MKILIAQSADIDFCLLSSWVRWQGIADRIWVFSETLSISDYVEKNPQEPVLIICGQVFGFSAEGTEVGKWLKDVNPEATFVIYSIMPEKSEAVDGYFPKRGQGDHTLLCRFLESLPENANRETVLAFLRMVPGFKETL